MCKQNIIQHTCSHRGYGLIIPCISRAIHKTGFKRFVYNASSACPLPDCDGPKSTGTYSPEGHEDVLVNGNNITGFVIFTRNSELLASWEKGAYPLAEKDYTPPIPLSAIPGHLLETIADAIQAHCRNKGDGKGFQRTRQHRYWSHGLRWRVGDHADGDIWGATWWMEGLRIWRTDWIAGRELVGRRQWLNMDICLRQRINGRVRIERYLKGGEKQAFSRQNSSSFRRKGKTVHRHR